MVTGCGNESTEKEKDKNAKEQTLVCTNAKEEEGMITNQVFTLTFNNESLKHYTDDFTLTVTDAGVRENWQQFKESMNQDNKEIEKDGVSLKVEVNDKEYKYRTITDIDVDKANDEALTEVGYEGLKDNGLTLKDWKKIIEEEGATCEVK